MDMLVGVGALQEHGLSERRGELWHSWTRSSVLPQRLNQRLWLHQARSVTWHTDTQLLLLLLLLLLSISSSHPAQLSLLHSLGWEMSTSQSAVMLCCWGVKAGIAHFTCVCSYGWQVKLCDPLLTGAILERLRGDSLTIKCYTNLVYFTLLPPLWLRQWRQRLLLLLLQAFFSTGVTPI